MPSGRPAMCRIARQLEQSLADAVEAALPTMPIDFDLPSADAFPAAFAPSQADQLALIDASFEALAARGGAQRRGALERDAASLRKALLDQA